MYTIQLCKYVTGLRVKGQIEMSVIPGTGTYPLGMYSNTAACNCVGGQCGCVGVDVDVDVHVCVCVCVCMCVCVYVCVCGK